MPDLTKFLTFSDLQPFFDSAHGGDITNAWRENYQVQLRTIVFPRLGAFFRALKEEGRVVPIPNSDGYSCRRWNAWNAVARLTAEQAPEVWTNALDSLAREFAHRLVFDITYPYSKVMKDQGLAAAQALDMSEAYNKEAGKFTQGTFENYEFSHENCWETDTPLLLGFANWVPEGYYITDRNILPVPPLEKATVQETMVVLKTGNLLVNDWFRIPEFTAALGDEDFPINSRKGREDQTRHYASFGVIHVGVGNSCAGVYQHGNQVVVGRHDEDESDIPEQLTAHGSVCTDLWAATLVEYETLVALVARTLPDTAKAVVDAYLAEQSKGSYGVMSLTLEPGTYYLYHYGKHHQFAEMARAAGIPLERSIDAPYFLLSKERLLPKSA